MIIEKLFWLTSQSESVSQCAVKTKNPPSDSTKASVRGIFFTYFYVIFSSFAETRRIVEETRSGENCVNFRGDGAERHKFLRKLGQSKFLVQQTSCALFSEFSLMRCGCCLWVIISHSARGKKEEDRIVVSVNKAFGSVLRKYLQLQLTTSTSLTSSCVARIVFWCSTMTTRLGRRQVDRRDVTVNEVVKVLMES